MKPTIENVLKETREFKPSPLFQSQAHLGNPGQYEKIWSESQKDPVAFWESQSSQLHWFKKHEKTLEWNEPFAKWFVGGKLNAAYNCLDRHLGTPTENKHALIWEGEEGEVIKFTYKSLHQKVCELSNVLENQFKLKPGDTAAIYLPLVPEAVIAMLACARIGVAHSVIFAGFASNAIRDRVNDAESRLVITSDVGYRKGQTMNLLETVRTAVKETPSIENVLVLRRKTETELLPTETDWNQSTAKALKTHTAKPFDSEQPLFFLYTSGTTGKPKGIVHTTGGYLLGTHVTAKWVFDLKPTDVYWCTADIGWITGHSYLVYGILSNAMTAVLYEGNLMHPHPGRIWEIVDKHKVTILYTAPTAIRSFMRLGDEIPKKYHFGSLRLLGSVGEPINPEAWMWYYQQIGKQRCPIVDTWWQTETGCILISALPGVTTLKPGSATRPFPGIVADIVNEQGEPCAPNEGGYLVIKHPWPSMLRNIHKDPDRFREQYWSKFRGMYFAGDGAHKDQDGYFWIMGRVDDVLNVSGHRLGTSEIESALVSHPQVAEAAVVGRPDDLKGQAIVAFVTPRETDQAMDLKVLGQSLKDHVVREIGAIARPDSIQFTRVLPKTRSGKIMRRILKELASGKKVTGDTTTLENAGIVELIE